MSKNLTGGLRLSFEIDIASPATLWDAAVQRAATDYAMPHDDVVETIGPREDPDIEACVAMLLDTLIRQSDAPGMPAVMITALTAAVEEDETLPRVAAMHLRPIASPSWTGRAYAA